MFCRRLVLLLALGAMTHAPALAADPPMPAAACPPVKIVHHRMRPRVSVRPAPPRMAAPVIHEGPGWRRAEIIEDGGVAGVSWGMTSGIGQLGAAGTAYIAVNHCWTHEPVYDQWYHYLGDQAVNICFEMHP